MREVSRSFQILLLPSNYSVSDTRPVPAAKAQPVSQPARAPLAPRPSVSQPRASMGSQIPTLNGFGYNPSSGRQSFGGQFSALAPPPLSKPDPLENLEEKVRITPYMWSTLVFKTV